MDLLGSPRQVSLELAQSRVTGVELTCDEGNDLLTGDSVVKGSLKKVLEFQVHVVVGLKLVLGFVGQGVPGRSGILR